MFRGVLFDFNGVLVDDEALHAELAARVLDEEGVALDSETVRRHFLGISDRVAFSTALRSAGRGAAAEPAYLGRLVARKASYYRDAVRRDGVPFFPGGARLIEDLYAAGVRLGVVSGALHEEIHAALTRRGLDDRFAVIIAGDEVREGKPNAEGYLLALAALNERSPLPERLIHGHEVVAIEDSLPGIEAARSADLAVVGVAHSCGAAALRAAGAHRVVERLDDLRIADLENLFAERSGSRASS